MANHDTIICRGKACLCPVLGEANLAIPFFSKQNIIMGKIIAIIEAWGDDLVTFVRDYRACFKWKDCLVVNSSARIYAGRGLN